MTYKKALSNKLYADDEVVDFENGDKVVEEVEEYNKDE